MGDRGRASSGQRRRCARRPDVTWTIVLVLATTSSAFAQVGDIEVPQIVLDRTESSVESGGNEDLDLANIVQSAAKGLTTVQEAPAIVTVVTEDEIRERQFLDLLQLSDTVPGWQRNNTFYGFFLTPSVRGQVQAVQFLHDGLSLFDPMANMPNIGRQMPMELIKRVEMITGPGGVLWGSNSLLGIMNVITKDAEDVEGVQVGSSMGHAPGDRMMARAYLMAGDSHVLKGKLKLFGHASVETFQGAEQRMPIELYASPLPQPNSPDVYGPLASSDQKQSLLVNFFGKATFGKLQVRAQIPFGDNNRPLAMTGNPVREHFTEDSRCSPDGYTDAGGVFHAGEPDPTCTDSLRKSRDNAWLQIDRYVVAEYRDHFAKDKADIVLRGYAQQFIRGLNPMAIYTPSTLIQGGLAFTSGMTTYRAGGAFDGGVEMAKPLRLLYGAEAFTEWLPSSPGDSRGGAGSSSVFYTPYDATRLPLLCPRIYDPDKMAIVPVANCPMTFAFQTSRSVLGAYISPQVRPNKRVILDGGARVQVAPEQLGTLGYDMSVTTAGTIVWNFVKNWHIKLNYAEGFRPPVFNNTSSNGEAVQIAGNPNLKVETSDALQAEINARVFKGERRIRELSFRVDGSYTRLHNVIQIQHGYSNSGDRAISSAEFLGKLYVQGGHRLELAYTWMRVGSADRGVIRSLPEHAFNFATVFNMWTGKLTGTTNLKVTGATEDPNRLVEYRDSSFTAEGGITNPVNVDTTDLVLDRLPPIAELALGVTWTPSQRLLVRATVYNALMQRAYVPDVFFDYEPHLETMPNPYESLRAYVSAVYQY
ncbi:MAG TPA: TonB-dependent receptor [Kofleriaceae bacterium]